MSFTMSLATAFKTAILVAFLLGFLGPLLVNAKEFEVGRKLFFDFGANDGSSVAFFVTGNVGGEGVQVQGSAGNNGILRGDYNGKNMFKDNDWNLYVFEANNRHTPKLEALKHKLLESKAIESFHLFNGTAITTTDGVATFTFDLPEGDAGSSLMTESYSAVNKKVEVKAVDVATLFKNLKIVDNDYVVVKMDIEGAEYDVMRRIIVRGLLPLIDRIAVEWHHDNIHVFGANGRSSAERKQIHEKYVHQYNNIMWMLDGSGYQDRFSLWDRRRLLPELK